MSEKQLSTFEREMQDPLFREQFDKEYDEFLLSEIIKALMKNGKMSVRKLAEKAGLSTTVIQKIRSGEQDDVKLSNFLNISHSCGFKVILEKGDDKYYL
ncbi:TPA: helix-turn-helix domain-containing protein [Legionella pneumophila]|nr:helix-turn-helix domain-containing protein [Legionella pneumophila]HDI4380962.1 helix-turn-helix domain-containing protein [Legionella pneumophila]HDI4384443.1 helix-turn-helix domain-containing protein [Legionella pneumophila]HDI4387355.1 helix-turn-helix domain-containing protein [Legionella pneumophila]HDI4399899.1 helix-turn-helix domain-containing protein [Legionella pneumophila]